MLIVGIDENGLGPLLGPLVVTGATFRARSYDRERFRSLAGSDLPAADSKVLFSPTRAAAAEDAVLKWLDVFGLCARDSAELGEEIVAAAPFAAPCPSEIPDICAGEPLPLPRAAAVGRGAVPVGVWERFARAEIGPGAVAAHVLCAGAFNRALEERRMNKLRLDFALMMSVARRLCAGGGGDALVLCGKVGGTAAYGAWLEAEGFDVAEVICEGRDESAYAVRGIGRIRFLRDGDAAHLPIAVASMVGKYLRELAMERLNRALGWPGAGGGQRRASGYRDPVTAQFVANTAAARAEAGIADGCFRRRA